MAEMEAWAASTTGLPRFLCIVTDDGSGDLRSTLASLAALSTLAALASLAALAAAPCRSGVGQNEAACQTLFGNATAPDATGTSS